MATPSSKRSLDGALSCVDVNLTLAVPDAIYVDELVTVRVEVTIQRSDGKCLDNSLPGLGLLFACFGAAVKPAYVDLGTVEDSITCDGSVIASRSGVVKLRATLLQCNYELLATTALLVAETR